jgi:hypothetical protein
MLAVLSCPVSASTCQLKHSGSPRSITSLPSPVSSVKVPLRLLFQLFLKPTLRVKHQHEVLHQPAGETGHFLFMVAKLNLTREFYSFPVCLNPASPVSAA